MKKLQNVVGNFSEFGSTLSFVGGAVAAFILTYFMNPVGIGFATLALLLLTYVAIGRFRSQNKVNDHRAFFSAVFCVTFMFAAVLFMYAG